MGLDDHIGLQVDVALTGNTLPMVSWLVVMVTAVVLGERCRAQSMDWL